MTPHAGHLREQLERKLDELSALMWQPGFSGILPMDVGDLYEVREMIEAVRLEVADLEDQLGNEARTEGVRTNATQNLSR